VAALLIAAIRITDPELLEEYRRRVPAVIEVFGGRYLVRGGAIWPLQRGMPPGKDV
jgi:uncharacterized protein (DUF1330 family)